MPTVAIDPDGGDIIILGDSGAVGGLGHAAVLIGNDKDGWRYVSNNGTGSGASPWGKSRNADLGNIPYDGVNGNDFRGTGLTSKEVMVIVNSSNSKEHHNYDKSIKIVTTSAEDEAAFEAATGQGERKTYGIVGPGASCIDPPQAALQAALENRLGKELSFYRYLDFGFDEITPNVWIFRLLKEPGNYLNDMNSYLQKNERPVLLVELIEIGIDDGN